MADRSASADTATEWAPPELHFDENGRIHRKAIEYNVVEHCNLKCANCDHSAPWLSERESDVDSFFMDATALATVIRAEKLRLVGGEPLLHPRLVDLLIAARKSGIADGVQLWTNGVLLHEAPAEVFENIDFLNVSRYPGVNIRIDLAELERLAERHRFRLKIRSFDRFERPVVTRRNDDEQLVRRIYLNCGLAHKWECHSFSDGWYYKCCRAETHSARLRLHGQESDNRAKDGVRLRDNPNLRAELIAYLGSDEPLDACSWCLGTSGLSEQHRQLNAAGVQAEIAEPRGVTELLQPHRLAVESKRVLVRIDKRLPKPESKEG